jgi:transposase
MGADVLFLPPYSPEYNPIEQAWSKLKGFVRRLRTLMREAL